MPSTCVVCNERFNQWMLYKMHMEMKHQHVVSGPIAKKLLTKEEKAILVAKGETRLGVQHFIGFKTEA